MLKWNTDLNLRRNRSSIRSFLPYFDVQKKAGLGFMHQMLIGMLRCGRGSHKCMQMSMRRAGLNKHPKWSIVRNIWMLQLLCFMCLPSAVNNSHTWMFGIKMSHFWVWGCPHDFWGLLVGHYILQWRGSLTGSIIYEVSTVCTWKSSHCYTVFVKALINIDKQFISHSLSVMGLNLCELSLQRDCVRAPTALTLA